MTPHADRLARYRRLRQVGRDLNNRLVKRLPGEAIGRGARRLGLLERDNVLALETEDEMAVLMDHILHDDLIGDASFVRRSLDEAPPPEGTDERLVLEALSRSWYSLFHAVEVEPGVGAVVEDALRGGTGFLVDINLSKTLREGSILALRVFEPDDFLMTTGAGLPVDGEAFRMILDEIGREFDTSRIDFSALSARQAADLATLIIRSCLATGAAARIHYANPPKGTRRRPAPRAKAGPGRIVRNAPCPCGSGKNFQQCCGINAP